MRKLAYSLILIPIILVSLRVYYSEAPDSGVISDISYSISFQHHLKAGETYHVEAFVPQNTIRQEVAILNDISETSDIKTADNLLNRKIIFRGSTANDTIISYSFTAKTRHISYDIDPNLELDMAQIGVNDHLHATFTSPDLTYHPAFYKASDLMFADGPMKLRNVVSELFEYVEAIPSIENVVASDAFNCYENDVCTEEGKSRLLIELLQTAGIPARLAGGLVLTEKKKADLNYWVQAKIANQWVTFDPERGHFAELPASHLELFRGDDAPVDLQNISNAALSTGSASYYQIEQVRQNSYPDVALFDIWNLIDNDQLPLRPVMVLLLLPLGAYIVAICTNVVGFKTYGVFLPVLIAFAFIDMGLLQGLLFFTVIIGLISLMSFPLERWGILHTPKIVCLLTAVGIYCLAAVKLFYVTGWVAPSATLTFPIIILTLIAERFAQKVEEESITEALFIYGQTLIVTLICYWILSASVIQHAFITFPELLFGIAGLSLLLGKWIGLQLFEYSRFSKLNDEVSYVK